MFIVEAFYEESAFLKNYLGAISAFLNV